ERYRRKVERHDDPGHLTRVHLYRLLPAQLVRRRGHRRTEEARRAIILIDLECLAIEDLHVNQMEVDGGCIAGQIRDFPNLDCAGARCFRGGILVCTAERILHQPWDVGAFQMDKPSERIKGLVQRERPGRNAWRRHWNATDNMREEWIDARLEI